MLECLLGGAPTVKDTGPGPQDLVKSYKASADKVTGYYGTLLSTEFITYDQLKTDLKVSGTLMTDVGWMKLHIDGKVLFVPRRCICNGVSWDGIYYYGLMYGIDGNGITYNTVTPRNQLVIKTIQGYNFKVRCFVGANANPTYITNSGDTDSSLTKGCEYDRLMLNMDGMTSANQEGPKFANVFVGSNDPVMQHVANYSSSVFSNNRYTISRRGGFATAFNSGGASTGWGWLPVLELVGKA